MGDVILYKEDVDRLNFLLKNLIADSKVLSTLLITKDTRVLACQGTLSTMDTSALAALLVGSFASTQAIAGLIGETEFETMSHLGKTRNVIISLVDDDTILASVYDRSSSVQRISASLNKHLEILRKSLKAIGGNTTDDLFASPESQNSSADVGIDFEKRTEDLFKDIEPKGPIESEAPFKNLAKPPDTHIVEVEVGDIRRPKEEPAFQSNKADGDYSVDKKAPPVEKVPLTSKDYDVYALNEPINHPLHQPLHQQEKRLSSPAGSKTEGIALSMNYLKNKAREGAVYYKRDEAIFKKIFKTAKKKKTGHNPLSS
jgi:predicted regulator of Ras-like GTPase activity (Roadblock/LC7/MglB family)